MRQNLAILVICEKILGEKEESEEKVAVSNIRNTTEQTT